MQNSDTKRTILLILVLILINSSLTCQMKCLTYPCDIFHVSFWESALTQCLERGSLFKNLVGGWKKHFSVTFKTGQPHIFTFSGASLNSVMLLTVVQGDSSGHPIAKVFNLTLAKAS